MKQEMDYYLDTIRSFLIHGDLDSQYTLTLLRCLFSHRDPMVRAESLSPLQIAQ